MNEEMLRGLVSRRSNRAFAPEQITDEELQKVLAAGMNAPTAKNGQSPIIIAVQNPDEVAAVNALNAKFTPNANPYYGAPTILLVLVPRTFPLGDLDLRKPIYRRLAAYGHMGREDLGVAWEKTDRTEELKKAVQG